MAPVESDGAPPARQGHPTGLSAGELVWRITESRVYAADREEIRARARATVPGAASEALDWLKGETPRRKKQLAHLYETTAVAA